MLNIASANPVHSARERLLDTAAELFATHGFQAVGLRDLASCLGLHAGSLYHHIENKQSLLFELIESALSNLILDTTRRLKGARNAREHLPLFIKTFVVFNVNERHKLVLITREFANLDEEQKQQIVELKNRYSALLSDIIADEQGENGSSASDICTTANAVIVILFGQSQWYNIETIESKLTKTLTNLVMCLIAQNNSKQEPAALQRSFHNSASH